MVDVTVTLSDAAALAIQAECQSDANRGQVQYQSVSNYVQYIVDLNTKSLISTYNTDTVAIDAQITELQARKATISGLETVNATAAIAKAVV